MTAVLILLCVLAAPAILWGRLAHFRRTAEHTADRLEVDRLVWAWRAAAEGSGIGRTTNTVTGPTISTPPVVSIVLGPPTVLVVRLLAGQVIGDIRKAAHRIAPHLGAGALQVRAIGHEHARIELLTTDPLAAPFMLTDQDPSRPLLLALDESGAEVREEIGRLPHFLAAGSTRSGKSTWLAAVVTQLANRRRCRGDVLIGGIDASGLLLRPLVGGSHGRYVVCGLGDLDKIADLLSEMVDLMDERIAAMPPDVDVLPINPTNPALFVILEEWAGTLRALDQYDKKVATRARTAVSRLVAEGHKAGLRLIVCVQRGDAAVVGGYERAQLLGRITFPCDSPESIRLSHPDADLSVCEAHVSAPAGVALLSLPGRPLSRVRGPFNGGYAEYVRKVS